MSDTNEEHMQVLDAFINEIVAMRARFADYVAKFELYGQLTRAEAEFMNEIALACQKLADTNSIRTPNGIIDKEELH